MIEIIAGIFTGAVILAAIIATARSIRRDASGKGCDCSASRGSCPYGSREEVCREKGESCPVDRSGND